MSDISILSDPFSIAIILLILGSPGIPIGAIAGALVGRSHRILGAVLGAILGFALFLGGAWLYLVY